jgi:hypothetical protein
MKYLLFSTAILLSLYSHSQKCENYYYMTNNSHVEVTIFDAKGKTSGVQTWNITDVKKVGTGVQSTVNMTFKDDKGKQVSNSSGVYRCINGSLQADIRMTMPQEQMQTYKSSAKLEPVYIEYPAVLSTGQTLKEADFKMDVEMANGIPATINFKQNNRKVEGQEKVTTPAGSWDAYLITYDGFFRAQMSGIGIPFNMKVKEWFVPNFGIVKTELITRMVN